MLDFDDERIRALLREELDRREAEKQHACLHRRSGTILSSGVVRCDDCQKILDLDDKYNAYAGPPAPLSAVERRVLE